MTEFLDVVRNFGDFPGGANWQPGPAASGAAVAVRSNEGGAVLETQQQPGPQFDSPYVDKGYYAIRQQKAAHNRRLYETQMMRARDLIVRAFGGNDYARLMMRDAMQNPVFAREGLGISDFPKLFGDVIDRAVLANYAETPYTYDMYADIGTVNDFRTVKRFRIDGASGILADLDASGNLINIPMGGQYPEAKLTDSQYTYQVAKIGRRMPFYWETFVNDDLDAIKDTPARFGRGARRTREYFVTKLFANNATFFSAANKNILTTGVYAPLAGLGLATNPPFSITALNAALGLLAAQRDKDGGPIMIDAAVLVFPPSMKVTVNNVLNADYFWATDQGGTNDAAGGQRLNVKNWARNIVQPAENYFLPIADTTHGTTGWYVFASPKNNRPAIQFATLRGHADPELHMKATNAIPIGEGTFGPGAGPGIGTGQTNPMEGDFDTDSIHYRIRDVFGGTMMDPVMAVYSNGSGS